VRWLEFSQTHEGALVVNRMQAIWQGCVSVAVIILAIMVFNKDSKTILQPETLGVEAWITRNDASQSYKEAWGLMLAMLSGNVTPENVTFIKDRYKPLLSPRVYNEIIDALEADPPATLKQAQARIKAATGLERSLPQVGEFLKKTNFAVGK